MYFQRLLATKQSADIWQEEKKLREETYEEIKKLLYCILAVAVLVIIYLSTYSVKETSVKGGVIEKTEVETQYQLSFQAEDGSVKGNTKITLPERPYSQQEAQELFEQAEMVLEQEILGENQNLEKVSKDLNFCDSIENNPVYIQWSTDREELLNSQGQVFCPSQKQEGETVIITAQLSLGEYVQEYSFPVCVAMPDARDKVWWQRAVERSLQGVLEQGQQEKQIKLPELIEGYAINFQEKQNQRPWYLLLAIPMVGMALFYGNQQEAEKKKKERNQGLLRDYPELLSRFSLYIQAGMTSKNALGKLVNEYETHGNGKEDNKSKKNRKKETKVQYGYEELQRTYYELQGGISEHEAYKNLGERVALSEYKRFCTLMIQQLEKGSKGFLTALQQETGEAFEKRKRLAREAGEEAGTKMLLPMGMLFVITLVLIMVPPCFSFIM